MARKSGFVKARLLVADCVCGFSVARREQIGRVNSAREERLLVRNLGILALLVQDFLNHALNIRGVLVGSFGSVGFKLGLPVTVELKLIAVPNNVVTGHKLRHTLVEGLAADRESVEQILLQHTHIELFFKAGDRYNLVYISGAHKLSVNNRIKHLLLTDLVSYAVGLAGFVIAQRERKSAVDIIFHFLYASVRIADSLSARLFAVILSSEHRLL